jgi:hypothetical protein
MTWLKVLNMQGHLELLNSAHIVHVERVNDEVSKLHLSDGHAVNTEAGLASIEMALCGGARGEPVGRPRS